LSRVVPPQDEPSYELDGCDDDNDDTFGDEGLDDVTFGFDAANLGDPPPRLSCNGLFVALRKNADVSTMLLPTGRDFDFSANNAVLADKFGADPNAGLPGFFSVFENLSNNIIPIKSLCPLRKSSL